MEMLDVVLFSLASPTTENIAERLRASLTPEQKDTFESFVKSLSDVQKSLLIKMIANSEARKCMHGESNLAVFIPGRHVNEQVQYIPPQVFHLDDDEAMPWSNGLPRDEEEQDMAPEASAKKH